MLVYLMVCAFLTYNGQNECGRVADFVTIEQCQDAREGFLEMKLIDRAYCEIDYDDNILVD